MRCKQVKNIICEVCVICEGIPKFNKQNETCFGAHSIVKKFMNGIYGIVGSFASTHMGPSTSMSLIARPG